ncbi:MAG: amidohydrolase family protein, partial [Hyphomicrobiales bacterium]|nr:amidohydrolase family protein [Hyphomicrobiales bacterium]
TRFPRIPADRALALMEALAATNLPLGLHNEDQEIVAAATAACRAAGMNDIAAHSAARPVAAELSATTHFLELGAATGAHAHLVHLSTARGFDLVAAAVQTGARATGELCVHYLWFDPETDGDELGALMKVNPPIRASASDELWHRVTNGGVAFISSDHSSWPVDNKRVASVHDAGAGVPGVETLLPAFHTVANSDGTDRPLLVARMLSEAPARLFGLWPSKGAIIIGTDADLAIYMPGDTIWDAENAHDELRWSPYHGRRFDGRVIRTYVRGKLAWDGTDIVNRPGDGRYV